MMYYVLYDWQGMTSFAVTLITMWLRSVLSLNYSPLINFKPSACSFSQDDTTPLSHAAYKGNKEACNILLEHGADVNLAQHEDKVIIPYLVMFELTIYYL